MAKLKTYKRLSAASKVARERNVPIYQIGDSYLVPDKDDRHTEFTVMFISGSGESWDHHAHVSIRHLLRLGNANTAERGITGQPYFPHPAEAQQ